jgi:glycosyltransferase involved in cell wall biosynthesis
VCSGLDVGGAERQWSLLVPALRSRFGVAVLTLVSEGPFFDELARAGIPVACAHMSHRGDLRGVRRALRGVGGPPALVVSMSINAHVVAHVIARRQGVPHVANEHAGPEVPIRRHRRALTRLVAPRVDGVIAVSEIQAPSLVAQGYRRERIRVIHNGVPIAAAGSSRADVRRELGLAEDDFVAALVATLRPEKRVDVFVRAVREAHERNPRVRGLVVGGGPELESLRTLAANDSSVRLLGERRDVGAIFAAADVACLSSAAEGVPMALLEAMAVGKPIVATRVGGIPEAVIDGTTGLLVPPGDPHAFAAALLELAEDGARVTRFGEAARVRQRNEFGFERMVDAYARAFDEMLARSRRA